MGPSSGPAQHAEHFCDDAPVHRRREWVSLASLEGLLRTQSTAQVARGGSPFRVGDRFELEGAKPPPGFDSERDGVCVHRQGTILYLSPSLPRLLSKGPGVDLVGARVLDLVA